MTNATVESFNVQTAIQFIEMLVEGDEVERALLVLDNLPAYYRDNPPFELVRLRQQILGAICTPHAYLSSGFDDKVRPEQAVDMMRMHRRGQLVELEVKRYNGKGRKPHVVDFGPGEYFIGLGLKGAGYDFTYDDIAMDQNTQKVAHEHLQAQRVEPDGEEPRVFVALEIIEHLPNELELATEALRHCDRWPERVHLSTPRYTYDGGKKDWKRKNGLPHLRAYTPFEFYEKVRRIFPGYRWDFCSNEPILSLRGQRQDMIDSEPLMGTR